MACWCMDAAEYTGISSIETAAEVQKSTDAITLVPVSLDIALLIQNSRRLTIVPAFHSERLMSELKKRSRPLCPYLSL